MKNAMLSQLLPAIESLDPEDGEIAAERFERTSGDPAAAGSVGERQPDLMFDRLLIAYLSAEIERKTAWNTVVRRYSALVHGESLEHPSAAELLAVHRATQRVQESEQKITAFVHTRCAPKAQHGEAARK